MDDAETQNKLVVASENGTDVENVQDNGANEAEKAGIQEDSLYNLKVHLPREPKMITIMVSTQEQMHDVRQSIIELPGTYQYSCFHLEHKGERINDFVQLSEVKDLTAESELHLIEDPYTEKEARLHVARVRELIGSAGNRTDTLHGILSGTSLIDSVTMAADSAKTHPMSGYDFDAEGGLASLLPTSQDPPPKTVKSISISPWNPPPYHLRQKGHLLYILITTLEGEQHHITSHVSGFYVNKSSSNKFDPMPRAAPKSHKAHSLLTLIEDLSPSFGSVFQKYLEFQVKKEPLAHFQITNATPANPWIVPNSASSLVAHEFDITRTQESYLIGGIDNAETLRDWNEEFQSTRELPKEGVQDRVFRERLTSKLFADYNEAAARGALLVARGEVAPLNPTETRDAQIFVYNNIFFSYGADGVGTFASEGGDEAARAATGKDVMGVRMVNQLDIEGLFTPGTVVVDYLGKRIVGQSIVPGIFKQRDPEENQIDYGGVDGKDVVAADEKFGSVFETLSKSLRLKKHAVWDKNGKRFDLEGSVETKGLLGTDGRKYVLDLYRVTPLDISWMEEVGTALGSPGQTNGVVENAYPHRMTVLRPELVDAYFKSQMRVWVSAEVEKRKGQNGTAEKKIEEIEGKNDESEDAASGLEKSDDEEATKAASAEGDKARIDIADFKFSLNPDAFSGQEPKTDEEKAELEQDEKDVRNACEFLRASVLPELVKDLTEGDVGFPMDGQSLSRLLHKRGINIRYLGKIAEAARGDKVQALRILSIQEMISRAFKHVASRYLRYLPVPLMGSGVAHLLNCLLGAEYNPKPKAEIDEDMASLYPEADLDFQKLTPQTLRKEIELQILRRFRYTIETSWSSAIKPVQLLRDVSLKLGLQIELKEYHFTKQTAVTNGHSDSLAPPPTNGANGNSAISKKKKKRDASPAAKEAVPTTTLVTFSPSDIVNVAPVIKEASPRSSLAEEALEAGRISIMQGQKDLGRELLLESLSLHEQIYGIIHPEVARVYNTLSMIYYQLEEKDIAVELARKAVIVSERTLGVDNAETLLSYLNLALFLHAYGQTKEALVYLHHALCLWKVIYGPNHPDSITTLNNAAVMLQNLKEYHESRVWFEASLKICEDAYGKSSINSATLLFQLAQALALDSDSHAAVKRIRESYNIFHRELGAENKNTKEAENWLEQLTQNAVSVAKHAKETKARQALRGPSRVLGQTRPQPQVGQTVEAASGRSPSKGLDSRTISELVKFIEGVDGGKTTTKKGVPGRSNPKRRGGATK
ncbi:clustered mitochondria-domain-containing protein [Calycina marina]|uniref:Clustered mitochondria protein homolog n=1 Tax=Calycina marina TaxID=1763456 RepID=A0A9P7Z9J3_9HELO|nr:clustered mitochondria-domain-containing protein [Calycina marina]